jgi:fibro-slime domain-containing protein
MPMTYRLWTSLLLAAAILVPGCGARTDLPVCRRTGEKRPCETVCGKGFETCEAGQWQACDAPKPSSTIPIDATIRDFHSSHPDFEEPSLGLDLRIVESALGADGKPVYAGEPTTPTTTGQENFDQWYREVPDINTSTLFTVPLAQNPDEPSEYRFYATDFFPIDGKLFGNEERPHNFHFTLEMQIPFRYVGGETLTFSGDDDLWIFINDTLAIDLGGVHSTETRTIDLDALAEHLGITPGGIFPFALFFAERHTDGSNFSLETTISEFAVCPEQ